MDKSELARKKMLKLLRDYIFAGYGKRCKSREPLCPVCKVWALYDLAELYL